MVIRADLHIHSCLSPCGDLAMSPREIARLAKAGGLSMAALTDHNSALNTPAFAEACSNEGICGLYGVEATTAEEAHVLALFPTVEEALALGEALYQALPENLNDPLRFGDQVYVSAEEEILGEVEKLLINATSFSLEDLAHKILAMGGLFIPAHIDRPSFSVISQLGFLPELRYSALEVAETRTGMEPRGVPVITASDAHAPEQIGGRYIEFEAEEASFAGLALALSRGRKIRRCRAGEIHA